MTKCAYCGRPFERRALGRPRRFCRASCRQRAFERSLRRSKTGLRHQPLRSYRSDDRVMTPPRLARALAQFLQPSGTILEPCAGSGNFVRALRRYGTVVSCEIDRGRDFFEWTMRVDWVITNPPWSQFAEFLAHSLQVANHVALMATVNHFWTRSRREMVREAGFGIERIVEFDAPREFKRTGFQLGMVLLTRGHEGPCVVQRLGEQ